MPGRSRSRTRTRTRSRSRKTFKGGFMGSVIKQLSVPLTLMAINHRAGKKHRTKRHTKHHKKHHHSKKGKFSKKRR